MRSDATVIRGTDWAATPNGNGTVKVLPKNAQANDWRSRFKAWFQWENLIVAGREVKGFVVTPAITAVFLVAFLGVLGWAYKSTTADSRETRDAVIRMETMLNERTRNFEREQDKFDAELKDERGLAQMHRENQDKKLRDMEFALKQKGSN